MGHVFCLKLTDGSLFKSIADCICRYKLHIGLLCRHQAFGSQLAALSDGDSGMVHTKDGWLTCQMPFG